MISLDYIPSETIQGSSCFDSFGNVCPHTSFPGESGQLPVLLAGYTSASFLGPPPAVDAEWGLPFP